MSHVDLAQKKRRENRRPRRATLAASTVEGAAAAQQGDEQETGREAGEGDDRQRTAPADRNSSKHGDCKTVDP
jgi:hypothetical protein